MNPQATKTINLFATVLFTIAGFACLGIAAYLTIKPAPAKQAQFIARNGDKAGCLTVLRNLGFTVSKPDSPMLTAEAPRWEDSPKEAVDKASLAIAACHVPMRSFCMGEGCATPGLTFTLDFTEAKVQAHKK